ncbi:MAG: hypothetical protein ABSA49_02255 [Rhizomicrobium sp.]|jgi:hypothetical protein
MMPKSLKFLAEAVSASLLVTMALQPASAGGSGGYGGGSGGGTGPGCHGGGGGHGGGHGGGGITIIKPVTINTNINIYKPVTINNDINISKNIDITKNITINNGGSASATASASASAGAFSRSGAIAGSGAVSGGGSYVEDTVVNRNAEMGTVNTSQACEMQDATVVKAIHAVCVSADGHEFPASHMVSETWIDASYEGEIARCIPGSTVKVLIGDVVQSDQGMAGSYQSGQAMTCGEHEALRHFKNGMLKCAPELPVKDCTERTNLRKYGTGDLFFSYRTSVCIAPGRTASARPVDLNGMTLEGGVGDGN